MEQKKMKKIDIVKELVELLREKEAQVHFRVGSDWLNVYGYSVAALLDLKQEERMRKAKPLRFLFYQTKTRSKKKWN